MCQNKCTDTLHKNKQSILSFIWPIHPICLVAVAPFLPTWYYLNRGFTVWYHYITIMYMLTSIETLRRFIIMQGVGICLGWYASIINDLYTHDRFGHILYMNMPRFMKNEMVDTSGHVFYTSKSMMYMGMSHVLDTIFHPGIVYILLKAHLSQGGKLKDIFTWNIMLATFLVSRLWCIVHTYHNHGEASGWYFGHDVYHIHDLDAWLPAYLAEGMFYIMLGSYKIFWMT
mmetsp:Transcript_23344/g.28685  ORF Transcript_23344/g.28685 Transcript_23344/m.28685 type:complete len:229 (-) Transcript_23344:65-751(-)